jgi:hypothetical protein
VSVPCSPTPAGSLAPGRCGARDAAFRCVDDVGSREDVDFGAQWHGPLTRCLRFAARVAPAPRKIRFRLLAKLCRAGLVTCRVPTKGFCVITTSPFPKLSWRTHSSTLPVIRVRNGPEAFLADWWPGSRWPPAAMAAERQSGAVRLRLAHLPGRHRRPARRCPCLPPAGGGYRVRREAPVPLRCRPREAGRR